MSEQNGEQTPKKNTRAEQSRINGAKSKGPITDYGKAISSRNVLKRPKFSQEILMDCECRELPPQIVAELTQQFNPQTQAEERLVEQIAALTFLWERLVAMQTMYMEANWVDYRAGPTGADRGGRPGRPDGADRGPTGPTGTGRPGRADRGPTGTGRPRPTGTADRGRPGRPGPTGTADRDGLT